MGSDEEFLQAIRDAGGLDPFDTLKHLVSPDCPAHLVHLRDRLMEMLLVYFLENRSDTQGARIKQTLWDARAAVLSARQLSPDERDRRLMMLDQIGRIVL